jgi:cytidine deaminase
VKNYSSATTSISHKKPVIIIKMKLTDLLKNQLITAARAALKNPYPKDAATVYSAAVLTTNGNVYSAAQYFSDTYSLTLHAEQCALVHAASHGEGDIVAIVVTSNENLEKGKFCHPCHMCKQLLWENQLRSGQSIMVALVNNYDEIKEVPLTEMVPYPWPDSHL